MFYFKLLKTHRLNALCYAYAFISQSSHCQGRGHVYKRNICPLFLLEPPRQPTRPQVVDPCYPSPCGPNAECIQKNQDDDDHVVAICNCLQGFPKGDPYTGCRPECVTNPDCPQTQACGSEKKCIDPCPGLCGRNAVCRVINHNPLCTCNAGYTGSPYQECRRIPRERLPRIFD